MNLRLLLVAVGLTQAACNPSSAPNAADDPKRSLGGLMYLSHNEPIQPLGTGPMFLTDVMIDGRAGEIFRSQDSACKENSGTLFEWVVPEDQPYDTESHHGMRLWIGEGRTLCFRATSGQTRLVWAGFRP